jgi:hypothetical protein
MMLTQAWVCLPEALAHGDCHVFIRMPYRHLPRRIFVLTFDVALASAPRDSYKGTPRPRHLTLLMVGCFLVSIRISVHQ